MAKSKTEYDANDIKKLQENMKKAREFMDAIGKIGAKMPRLEKALKVLDVAINTGVDVAAAASEAQKALEVYQQDLEKACGEDWVCKAKVDRKWQARALKFTLDPKNADSATAKSIAKTMARYLPKVICKQFATCAKELKKQEQAKKK